MQKRLMTYLRLPTYVHTLDNTTQQYVSKGDSHIYMYIHMCIYIYMYIYVCIKVTVRDGDVTLTCLMYIYIHICIYTYMLCECDPLIYTYMHVSTYINIYICLYIYVVHLLSSPSYESRPHACRVTYIYMSPWCESDVTH